MFSFNITINQMKRRPEVLASLSDRFIYATMGRVYSEPVKATHVYILAAQIPMKNEKPILRDSSTAGCSAYFALKASF
jgi:hypothetical protein